MLRRFRLFNRSKMSIDPVCQMKVDTKNPPGGTSEYEGTTYYFCGSGCRNAFTKDPATYLSKSPAAHGHSGSSTATVDPTAPLEFRVQEPTESEAYVDVEYSCPCGCQPGARYELGSEESASEHCCCGRVHFAGENAEQQLQSYMDKRAETDMDADVSPYVYTRTDVTTSRGVKVPVAYAQPTRPRK